MPHHLDHVDSIRADGDGFAAAAAVSDPTAAVVGCPGWTVADLVWHLRGVHYFWASIVEGLVQNPELVVEIERPADFQALLEDYRLGVDRLVRVLGEADQRAPVWTWASQKDVAFVTRHQAQEVAVHRWDAETAAGRDYAVNPQIAADAVDEFLQFSTASRHAAAPAVGGTVHLHATDVAGEWLAGELADGTLWSNRGHNKAEAALRASASDLLLILYRRRPSSAGEVIGDREVLDRFIARTDLT